MFRRIFYCIVLAAAACCLYSCNSANDILAGAASGGNTITQEYAPPSTLRALAGDDTIYLVWHPSPDADSAGFQGYLITAADTTSATVHVADSIITDTSAVIGGLTNDRQYQLFIESLGANNAQGTPSEILAWAPAKRYYGIQLYGLQSTCASGLRLSLANGVKAANVLQDPDSVDLVFDDRNGTFAIASPSIVTGFTLPRATGMSSRMLPASGLSDLSLADSVVDTSGLAPRSLGLSGSGKGIVYYMRTQDTTYARVFVHADANGDLVSKDTVTGDACNGANYITIDVSFQSAPKLIFAKTPVAVRVRKKN